MAVDFSFLDDLFTDEDTTDYTDVGLFDEYGNYNPDSGKFLDGIDDFLSYDPSNSGIGSFNINDFLNIDSYLDDNPLFDDEGNMRNLFQEYTGPGTVEEQVANFTNNFLKNQDYSYLFDDDENLIPSLNYGDEDDYKGIFGLGIGPGLKDFFLGTDDKQGLLASLLGIGGNNKKSGGILGSIGGGITDFANSPIGQLLLLNYLKGQDKDAKKIPIGAEAYGDQGLGSMPDYRIFNLQPALMPGVGYANAPPPGMKHGGVHGAGKREGPGDITLARLEPGEFVMTRKATENLGARNLYSLMKQAERMG